MFWKGNADLFPVGGCSPAIRWRSQDSIQKPSTYSSWTLSPGMTIATSSQTTNGSYISTFKTELSPPNLQDRGPECVLLCILRYELWIKWRPICFPTYRASTMPLSSSCSICGRQKLQCKISVNRNTHSIPSPTLWKGRIRLADRGGLVSSHDCPPVKSKEGSPGGQAAQTGIKVSHPTACCGVYTGYTRGIHEQATTSTGDSSMSYNITGWKLGSRLRASWGTFFNDS